MRPFSVLAAAALLAVTAAPPAQAIMEPTPGSQIYFVTSLQDTSAIGTSAHYCGGVLIASDWVITAKQCTEGRSLEAIMVRTGSRYTASGGELVTISRVVPNPAHDAALVQLSRRVDASPVVIADVPGPVGTRTRVLGWGQTCQGHGCGGPTAELQQVDSFTEPDSTCAVEKERICTRYPNGGGPCFGDEGGPLISGGHGAWRLIGLVPSLPPLTSNCLQGLSALINVTELRVWITEHTGG